jgi:hypothetical protein
MVWMVGLVGQGVPQEAGAPGLAMRFAALDVMIDTGPVGLGSYQVDMKALEGVKVVGVEGGESAAFREAPFYDPAALMEGERIVIASFSMAGAEQLPRGQVRVARVHVTAPVGVVDGALVKMPSKLVVATDSDGKTIAATMWLRVYQGEER